MTYPSRECRELSLGFFRVIGKPIAAHIPIVSRMGNMVLSPKIIAAANEMTIKSASKFNIQPRIYTIIEKFILILHTSSIENVGNIVRTNVGNNYDRIILFDNIASSGDNDFVSSEDNGNKDIRLELQLHQRLSKDG